MDISVQKKEFSVTHKKQYERMMIEAYGPRLDAHYDDEGHVIHFSLYDQHLHETKEKIRPSMFRRYEDVMKMEVGYLMHAMKLDMIRGPDNWEESSVSAFISKTFKHTNREPEDWILPENPTSDFIFATFAEWRGHMTTTPPVWLKMWEKLHVTEKTKLRKRFENALDHLSQQKLEDRQLLGFELDGSNLIKTSHIQRLNKTQYSERPPVSPLTWDAIHLRGGILIQDDENVIKMYILQNLAELVLNMETCLFVWITLLEKKQDELLDYLVLQENLYEHVVKLKYHEYFESHNVLGTMIRRVLQTQRHGRSRSELNKLFKEGNIVLYDTCSRKVKTLEEVGGSQSATVFRLDLESVDQLEMILEIGTYNHLSTVETQLNDFKHTGERPLWHWSLTKLIEYGKKQSSSSPSPREASLSPLPTLDSPFSVKSPTSLADSPYLVQSPIPEPIVKATSAIDEIESSLLKLEPKYVMDISPFEEENLQTSIPKKGPILLISKTRAFDFDDKAAKLIQIAKERNLTFYWCIISIPVKDGGKVISYVWDNYLKRFSRQENNDTMHYIELQTVKKYDATHDEVKTKTETRARLFTKNDSGEFQAETTYSHQLTELDDYLIEKVSNMLNIPLITLDSDVNKRHLFRREARGTNAFLNVLAESVQVVVLTIRNDEWQLLEPLSRKQLFLHDSEIALGK